MSDENRSEIEANAAHAADLLITSARLEEIIEDFENGNFKPAKNDLAEFIANKMPPESKLLPKAYTYLGIFSDHLGDADGAIQAWEAAIGAMEQMQYTTKAADTEAAEGAISNFIFVCQKIGALCTEQADNGSGYSRKKRSVCYGPKKTANDQEEEEWQKNKYLKAITYYKKAAEILAPFPEKQGAMRTKIADLHMKLKDYHAAMDIYAQANQEHPDDPKWLSKWASCLNQIGQKEEAFAKLTQLLEKSPSYVPALQQLEKHYKEKGDKTLAEETAKKIRFYGWVPTFCTHITYNPANAEIVRAFTGDEKADEEEEKEETDEAEKEGAEEKKEEKKEETEEKKEEKKDPMKAIEELKERTDEESTEFLIAICYHHYHGKLENAAFDALKSRAKDNEFVCDALFELMSNHGSVCTIKGVINILAAIKHEKAFDVLMNLLPQDVQMFPMNVPEALATLQDENAIPALVSYLKLPEGDEEGNEEEKKGGDEDSDSDDEIFAAIGNERLTRSCCLALGTFAKQHAAARAALTRASKDKRGDLRDCAHAALWVELAEPQSREYLLGVLRADGEKLDHYARWYLEERNKDEEVAELVKKEKEQDK